MSIVDGVQRAGKYEIHLEAPFHESIDLAVDYDGSSAPSGASVPEVPKGDGIALVHTMRNTRARARYRQTHALYALRFAQRGVVPR